MRRVMPFLLLLVVVSAGVVLADDATGVPVINLPYGAIINTEVLLSDNDLLGVIKEGIPAFVQLMGKLGGPQGMPPETVDTMISGVRSALADVKAVRFLAAQYPSGLKVKTLADTLNAEAKKSGKFTRIISRVSDKGSVVAIYSGADKSGYLGYVYDVKTRSMMAGRVVGFLDVQKLIGAATQMIGSLGFGALGSILNPGATPSDPNATVNPTADGTAAPSDDNGVVAPTTDEGNAPEATDGSTGEKPAAEPEKTE